jgi:acyl-CoA dehydrogenase
MNLNFSQEEITFQNEVREFLDKELTTELVNTAKRTSAVFTEKDVAMEWQSKLA